MVNMDLDLSLSNSSTINKVPENEETERMLSFEEEESASILPATTQSNLPTIIPRLETKDCCLKNDCNHGENTSLKSYCEVYVEKCNEVYNETTTKTSEIKKKERTGWKRYLGIILALSCSMLSPLVQLLVKALPQYHPFSVTFWRFQGVLFPAIPVAVYYRFVKKEKIFDSVFPLNAPGSLKTIGFLILRAATGASAVVCIFYSLQFISVADSTVISFSTPVFVTFAAHIFLGEKCGIIPIVSGLFTLAGVVIISRPPILTGAQSFDTNNLIGSGLALCCMLLATTTLVVIRYLRQIHHSIMNLSFGIWGTGEALILSLIIGTFQLPQGFEHWLMALVIASITGVVQTLMTLALKFEQAGTVSLVRSCDVIFAFIWQFLILGTVPDRFSVIGASVVIIGILLIGFRKWVSELSLDNKTRIRFNWLLK